MSRFKAISLAVLGAIAVQPVVLLAWLGLPALFAGDSSAFRDIARNSFMAAVFAVPFVVLVGVPATLLLARSNQLRCWLLGLIGFVSAGLPVALFTPGGGPGYSSGGNWCGTYAQFVVNGEPTLYGWLNYIQSIFLFGLHGLVGAMVFYAIWRCSMGPNSSFKPTPLRGAA